MNKVDIVLALLFAIAFFSGLKKGFILQLGSLLALILGIYGAMKFTGLACNMLAEKIDTSSGAYWPAIMFVVVFLVIVIAVNLLAKLVEKVFKLAALGWLNRIAGAFFNLLKWALILSILIHVSEKFGFFGANVENTEYQTSYLYNPLRAASTLVLPPLEDFYHEYLSKDGTTDDNSNSE